MKNKLQSLIAPLSIHPLHPFIGIHTVRQEYSANIQFNDQNRSLQIVLDVAHAIPIGDQDINDSRFKNWSCEVAEIECLLSGSDRELIPSCNAAIDTFAKSIGLQPCDNWEGKIARYLIHFRPDLVKMLKQLKEREAANR